VLLLFFYAYVMSVQADEAVLARIGRDAFRAVMELGATLGDPLPQAGGEDAGGRGPVSHWHPARGQAHSSP
jgi:hypothetical protein